MYDNIVFSYPCPTCQRELTKWQTKDYFNMNNTYPVTDLGNNSHIYGYCNGCQAEITLVVKHMQPPVIRVELWQVDDE